MEPMSRKRLLGSEPFAIAIASEDVTNLIPMLEYLDPSARTPRKHDNIPKKPTSINDSR